MNYALTVHCVSPSLTATAIFSPDFSAFQGHFPGHPILPGFMHIQLALDVLRAANLPHALREIPTAKFSAPILPNAAVEVTLTPVAASHYNATITADGVLASTFSLLTTQ